MEHLFLMFLDQTQRRTTFGRTLLDEWSARRRDLYLTTHDTYNRQISMPRWESNPRSQQVSGLRPLPCWVPPTVVRRCVWFRNINNMRSIYTSIYDISSLRVNDLILILLTWRIWWAPNNASRWQMGFNWVFKGLTLILLTWRKWWAPNNASK
jgi:hypothetical protein